MTSLHGGLPETFFGRSNMADQRQADQPGDCCNVLFICEDNAVSSITAEALLERWGAKGFRAFSAGVMPKHECNPLVAEVLKENRIWHDGLRSKGYEEFLSPDAPPMDLVISLGERPPAQLPIAWPGRPEVIHWHITEPATDGDSATKARSFRKTFLELENRIKLLVLVYQRERSRMAAVTRPSWLERSASGAANRVSM
ncbi:MAG TPA: hypothetical protein VMU16_00460 [Candidatus Binataceae bacterium]|nr:hypothetical protein [Candidatus Binataceae bacterium]